MIRDKANINIDLIDGATEAKIIYLAGLDEHIKDKGACLFVDVGKSWKKIEKKQ